MQNHEAHKRNNSRYTQLGRQRIKEAAAQAKANKEVAARARAAAEAAAAAMRLEEDRRARAMAKEKKAAQAEEARIRRWQRRQLRLQNATNTQYHRQHNSIIDASRRVEEKDVKKGPLKYSLSSQYGRNVRTDKQSSMVFVKPRVLPRPNKYALAMANIVPQSTTNYPRL